MKIMVVCGHGLGTSLMMEMSVKSIIADFGITADVDHQDLASAKGTSADVFIATRDIADQLESAGVDGRVIALKNMIDKADMKKRLSDTLTELGAL